MYRSVSMQKKKDLYLLSISLNASITPEEIPLPPWHAMPTGLFRIRKSLSEAIIEFDTLSFIFLEVKTLLLEEVLCGGILIKSPFLSFILGLDLDLLTLTSPFLIIEYIFVLGSPFSLAIKQLSNRTPSYSEVTV